LRGSTPGAVRRLLSPRIESEGTMRRLEILVFGMGAFVVGCGSDAPGNNPTPNPAPTDFDYCAVQHVEKSGGFDVVVCEKLYGEAPYLRVPEASSTSVIAGLRDSSFVTADGESYPYRVSISSADPEQKRHAIALYELTLEDGKVSSFRPAVIFDEALFVEPFLDRAFEGTVSRRDGEAFTEETTLPVRIEFASESFTTKDFGVSARGRIANLEDGVTAADGSCLPPITSYGDEAPFEEGAEVLIVAGRVPWMHGDDDQFVLDVIVDGRSIGSMMAPSWYKGPIDLVRGTLEPAGTYQGLGHGTPGAIPQLTLEPTDAGGEPCSP
jgi:hypothetical protein